MKNERENIQIIKTTEEFKEKLNNKNGKMIPCLSKGKIKSVKDFWDSFLCEGERLPNIESALQWHELLIKYTRDVESPVFPIRFDSEKRGYLTKIFLKGGNSKEPFYSFFFNDNEHAKYYYKLCFENYIPKNSDLLRDMYQENSFPQGTYAGGSNPGFDDYKLSHIVAPGEESYHYSDDMSGLTSSQIMEKYFAGGEWKKIPNSKFCYRELYLERELAEEARRYIVAMFLRYVHPFNYFLTPSVKHIKSCVNVYVKHQNLKDIGEYPPLVNYVQEQFSKKYMKYNEFLSYLMADGRKIDLEYNSEYENKTERLDSCIRKFLNAAKTNLVKEFKDIFPNVLVNDRPLEEKDYYKNPIKLKENNCWVKKVKAEDKEKIRAWIQDHSR